MASAAKFVSPVMPRLACTDWIAASVWNGPGRPMAAARDSE